MDRMQLSNSSTTPDWTAFDDLVMENIFEQLSIRDRFSASLVCRRWSLCFELPKIWRTVDIDEQWLTKTVRVDGQTSRVFDYKRVANCLQRIGHHIRSIRIQPSQDFVSVYQFFVLFTWFLDEQAHKCGSNLCTLINVRAIHFQLPCDQVLDNQPNGIKLFGIGGQLMASFKKLLSKLQKLRELSLIDLALERYEANRLADQICMTLGQTLQKFSVINLTLNHCALQQIAMLSDLEVLKLSPQSIDDSILQLIADSQLTDLHIVQNENTPQTVMACSAKAWSKFKRRAPHLRVHLSTSSKGNVNCDLLIQPEAPIYCIMCENVIDATVKKITESYSNSLVIYSDKGLTNCDNVMIELVSKCTNLSTLKISRPITSGALLMLVTIAANLRDIFVLKLNVIIKHDDWLTDMCLNNNVDYEWVQHNSTDHERVRMAISDRFSRFWSYSG